MYVRTRRISKGLKDLPARPFLQESGMQLPNPLVLAAIYGLSELYLALTRRSRTQAISRDRRSLMLLWTIIIVSLWLGIQMVWLFPNATVRYLREFCCFSAA
jgi:hypothetical protein